MFSKISTLAHFLLLAGLPGGKLFTDPFPLNHKITHKRREKRAVDGGSRSVGGRGRHGRRRRGRWPAKMSREGEGVGCENKGGREIFLSNQSSKIYCEILARPYEKLQIEAFGDKTWDQKSLTKSSNITLAKIHESDQIKVSFDK